VVMFMFTTALLLIKHSRPALHREPRNSLLQTLFALAIGLIAIAGNIVLVPRALLIYAIYLLVIFLILWALNGKVGLARLLYWIFDQSDGDRFAAFVQGKISKKLIQWIRKERRHPIIYFANTDVKSRIS
jgi:hypothetical protein